MNELIPIKAACIGGEEINAVNARDLYAALGIKKDFSTWVKAQIERAGFIEGVDYIKIAEKSSSPKKGERYTGPNRLLRYHPSCERNLHDGADT